MFHHSQETNTNSYSSESDGLADTESYKELLDDVDTVKLLKKEIENIIELRLQEMGISPQWEGIPQETFEKSMKIVRHQNDLLKKTISKFDHIKKKLDGDIQRRCQKRKERTRSQTEKKKLNIRQKAKEVQEKETKLSRNKRRNTRQRDTPKSQQNIVKILCRPKPTTSKSTDEFICPPRRNSVTISNPILFETQDSSTDSEYDQPNTASMKNVINKLESKIKAKKNNELMEEATTSARRKTTDPFKYDSESDISFSESKRHLTKQKNMLKNRKKSNTNNENKIKTKGSLLSLNSNNSSSANKTNLKNLTTNSSKAISIYQNFEAKKTKSTTNRKNQLSLNDKERTYNFDAHDSDVAEDNNSTKKNEIIINQRFVETKSSLVRFNRDRTKTVKPRPTIRFKDVLSSDSSFEPEKN